MPTSPGIFNTNNFSTDLVVKDFASMIQRYMPNGNAPLFAMTASGKEETATNTAHGYFAKSMVFPEIELTADITDTATVISVASTDNIINGMLFQFEATGENILVNQVLSGTSLSVTRGIGGGAAAIVVATDPKKAYQVGNAQEEGSLRPNALAITPVQITNLTQIFRNTYAITGTADAVAVIAGDSTAAENQRDAAAFHATDIETSLIWGKKGTGTKNGQPFRTMDGIINIVSNPAYYPAAYPTPNVFNASSGGTDATTMENYLDTTLNQQTDPTRPNERVIFTGGTGIRVFNDIAKLNGTYQLVEGMTTFGLQFNVFKTARGTFRLIEHPLFNTNTYRSKMALVMDTATFNIAYLKGRKTQDRKFNQAGATVAQDNGIDATGGTLTTECTALIKNPPANAVIYNLTRGLKNA
jgi:hypothetical protein